MRVSLGPFKAFMKKNNLLHSDVAQATGLSKRTVDALMQKRFSLDTLKLICNTYKLQLSDIVELCHEQYEDNAYELDNSLEKSLQAVLMMCVVKKNEYLKNHKEGVSVEEIYRDAFLDCLDLCYEYLK